jgi:hypothetical protein
MPFLDQWHNFESASKKERQEDFLKFEQCKLANNSVQSACKTLIIVPTSFRQSPFNQLAQNCILK